LRVAYPSSDPTFDELSQGLPMLDAMVHETLRLHPAVPETVRMVCCAMRTGVTALTARQPVQEDVLPLSAPLVLPDGQTTDHVVVPANQSVLIPIGAMNRMRAMWGSDAHEFRPERWLDGGAGIPATAKEIQGHRHLVTFIDGPRKYGALFTCQRSVDGANLQLHRQGLRSRGVQGKTADRPFRVLSKSSLQAVLSVLVRNYEFELPNGPKTSIRNDIAVVSRPTVEGLPRTTVPLRIRRVEQD
jgi:hypothetical protein